jgi:hypothetical protein
MMKFRDGWFFYPLLQTFASPIHTLIIIRIWAFRRGG